MLQGGWWATSPSCILSSTIPLTHLVSLPRCSKYTRTFHVPAVLCVSQLALSPICYARELFQTPISSSLLNSLLQFAYCCIINHLRVSGVTQGPFYLAHRLCMSGIRLGRVAAPVSGASAGKTHKAGGGRERLGMESPLEVLHSCLAPGL